MSSLWLGEDHLVYVRGSGLLMPFSEEYKRYRYRDIQAVSVAKTSRVVGIVLFILGLISCAGLMALVLWQIGDEGVTALKAVSLSVLSFGALAFAAGLLSHLILGPTCVCDIQTSLSRDRLRPLSRYLRALQVVDRLKGLVRESQEELAGNRGGGRGSDGNSPAATAAVGGPARARGRCGVASSRLSAMRQQGRLSAPRRARSSRCTRRMTHQS